MRFCEAKKREEISVKPVSERRLPRSTHTTNLRSCRSLFVWHKCEWRL